jgi:pimeloyl-ACP methyl ester carboxylesterase
MKEVIKRGLVLGGLSGFFGGCGEQLIPLPIPCPPCVQTETSKCDYIYRWDGTKIRTQLSAGNPALPTAVGVHGLGAEYSQGEIIFPRDADWGELFPLLTFSLPGNLCSDRLPNGREHTVEEGARALEEVILSYNDFLGDNYFLIGGSLGGAVVAEHAVIFPEKNVGRVIAASQATPIESPLAQITAGYIFLRNLSPFSDLTPIGEYLESQRTYDGSQGILQAKGNWLIISGSEDKDLGDGKAMAESLGENRARYFEFEGNHFDVLFSGPRVRGVIKENLDFLMDRG